MYETNNFLCLRFIEKESYNKIDGIVVKLGIENICTPFVTLKANKKCTLNVVSISSNGVRTLLFSSINSNKRWHFTKLKANTCEVCLQAIRNGDIIVRGKIEILYH